MTVVELFKEIEKTSSTAKKSSIMAANLSDVIKTIYDDCYNTQRNYGVKKFTPKDEEGSYTIDHNYDTFHQMLNSLNKRLVTGNAAVDFVRDTLAIYTKEDQEILKAIINRKLTIGLSKTSFDKLLSQDEVEKFEVTLAINLDKAKNVNPIDGTYYASRKCDGVRVLAFVDVNAGSCNIEFLSRQGKSIDTLNNVKPALVKITSELPDGKYVFDGEGCIIDDNGDEHFDWVMKEIKRKDHTIEHPCYQIFDFVTLDEFNGKTRSGNFTARLEKLKELFKNNTANEIKLLKQERITNQDDFDRWTKYVEEGNWEGFMLRKDIPFEKGRSKNLLKVKKFMDAEYIVEDIEISEMTAVEPGKGNVKFTGVKSLIITHRGNKVNVGSGLSKEQRIEWKNDPSKIIGKTATIQYFEETQNKDGSYSLRFPVLKYVYENGRNV